MNYMWNRFLTTKPKLLIGQQVEVIGEYAADWRGEICIVTGIEFSAVTGTWNISIMSKNEIEDECGSTDGFKEDELRPIHSMERSE